MRAGSYLFIPFLRTKSQMGQTKNGSRGQSHKKRIHLRTINERHFCDYETVPAELFYCRDICSEIQKTVSNTFHALVSFAQCKIGDW